MPHFTLACEHGRVLDVDLARTALLCIDFQGDFVRPDGICAARGMAVHHLAAALPGARLALEAARAAGMFVAFTREGYAPDLSDLNLYRRRHDSAVGTAGPLGRFLVRGEAGSDIVDLLAPKAGEPVIDKAGFSAFHGTPLDTVLRVRGIETLLFTGFTTQCCVASSLRAAVDLGYACVLLQDACAAFDPADHEATVRVTYAESHNFGWVSDALRLSRALQASPCA